MSIQTDVAHVRSGGYTLPDGVYVGLPEDVHHGDFALGSTDHKAILFSATQWYFKSKLNGSPILKETPAESAFRDYGGLIHTAVLEPDKFDLRYTTALAKPENLLTTKDQMAEALRGVGVSSAREGMPKDELVSLCRHMSLPTLEDWKEEAALLLDGRQVISEGWYNSVQIVLTSLRRHSRAKHVFKNGLSEVTIIWTDPSTGIRCKARIDYLRPGAIIDLKTYSLTDGQEAIDAFLGAVDRWGYDMQWAMYYEAVTQALPRLVEELAIYTWEHGDIAGLSDGHEDVELLKRIAACEKPAWTWVSVSTSPVPEIDVLDAPLNGLVHAAGKVKVDEARAEYLRHVERYGLDTPWVADRGLIKLSDESFRPGMVNRGLRKWTN